MGEEFEISKIEWVWTAEDLPKDWDEEDLFEEDGWEIHSFNEELEPGFFSSLTMNFKKNNDTDFEPSKNFSLFLCIKREDNDEDALILLVQGNRKYSIDIAEMGRRPNNNLDKKEKRI